ncbi:MAG: AAA family ATPase, partial [Myxococcales bacterium]|nr:AAA family ATPase [Myxococcales bacterium]
MLGLLGDGPVSVGSWAPRRAAHRNRRTKAANRESAASLLFRGVPSRTSLSHLPLGRSGSSDHGRASPLESESGKDRSVLAKRTPSPKRALERPPAELRYADELARLAKSDDHPKPPGWRLSPRAVRTFVLGDPSAGIERKFVGHPSLVDRAMVSLATKRGLMLIGEPGTAKSLLSELFAAAISGRSTLVIQGSAATGEEHIKYGWNYALLLAEGPTRRALVPGPLHTAMQEGVIVRFEEITRCPLEIQDSLLSALSDRVLAIPELDSDPMLFAAPGFNVIAT